MTSEYTVSYGKACSAEYRIHRVERDEQGTLYADIHDVKYANAWACRVCRLNEYAATPIGQKRLARLCFSEYASLCLIKVK